MPEDKRRSKRLMALVIFGILISLLAIFLPEQDQIAFEMVVNNTNLAPTIDIDHPGTGERVSNITYYANNSAIQIMIFAHAASISHTATVALYINDTLVLPQSGRPLAGAEEANRSVSAIIPKGASYKANFSNYHHYEWREYPILSGRNGTLSINMTGGGCTGDCSFNNLTANSLGKNDSLDAYVSNINLISPFAHYSANGITLAKIDITDGNTHLQTSNTSSTNISSMVITPENLRMEVTNANNNFFEIRQEESIYDVLGRVYTYNFSGFDLGGANLTNCANCGGNQNLTQVLDIDNVANKSFIEKRNGALIGSLSFVDLSTLGGVSINRTSAFFALNRIFNENTLTWSNGTYAAGSGMAFSLETSNLTSLGYPNFKMAYFLPNQTTYTYWYQSDKQNTNVIEGNFTLSAGNMTLSNIKGANAATTGNAYLCFNYSAKTVYVGNPTC